MAVDVRHSATFTGAVVLFAMPREARPFLRSWNSCIEVPPPGWRLCSDATYTGREAAGGEDCLVSLLGIGRAAARDCTEKILDRVPNPRAIIVAGYAGGLRPELSVGDVVVAADVIDPLGNVWPTSWPTERRGRVLTSDHFIEVAAKKYELGSRLQADAVEMESAAVAEVCRQRGVPFGCVRAISDAADTSLSPRVFGLMEDGKVRIGRVVREVVRSPRMIGDLIRLSRHTKLAARNLATVLRRHLQQVKFPT